VLGLRQTELKDEAFGPLDSNRKENKKKKGMSPDKVGARKRVDRRQTSAPQNVFLPRATALY
jgi:hypothetical protein